jgi:hypothetical protein
VVCAKCSNYSYKLDNLNKTARVCAFCFKDLTQTSPNSVSALPSNDSYENLVEFFSHVGDYTPRDDALGVVNVTVKRINANEKGMGMVKGKVLVPQTRKAQRKSLYNITTPVVNGGENSHGTSHTDHNHPDNPTDPSLPPLPPLLSTPRQRSGLASSTNLTPPTTTTQHNHSPNLHSRNLNANTPPSSTAPLENSMKSDRQGSVDSLDTQSSLTEPSEDLSSVPSSIDEHNPSPKLQPRQVAVGN